MVILGILGSPRVNGHCAKLLKKSLEGAAACGAKIKLIELIKRNIKYCMGCCTCFETKPELKIGVCPLKDDMSSILEEYIAADGYVFASPVYDVYVSALMKTFLERKIALTYRPKELTGKLPESRVPANFLKKASIIITGNCSDEYREVMGTPCFEAIEGHLMIEMVETVDQFYVGGIENLAPEVMAQRLSEAYLIGQRLVKSIEQARSQTI
ncbi:MAG: flavodoxin family protein [Desulfobacterota bacterium]|nr:flavodoxin family protein [Thermodesulfobacteriota bacterium]